MKCKHIIISFRIKITKVYNLFAELMGEGTINSSVDELTLYKRDQQEMRGILVRTATTGTGSYNNWLV